MAVTPVDVGGSIAKGLQINQMRQQREAEKQAQQDRLSLKSLYSERFGGVDPQTGIAWETGRQGPGAMTDDQFVGRVAQVDPGMALDWRKHFAAQEETKLERQKLEAPLFVGALEGVRDQEGYDSARQFLTQRGLDVSDMPPRYDPRQVNMVVQGSRYLAGITQPKGPTPTTAMKNALAQGFKPGTQAYNDYINRVTTQAKTKIDINQGQGLSEGQKAVDKAYADEYTEFVLGGQFADAQKGVDQLKGVVADLEAGKELTGTLGARFLPDSARAIVDPDSLDAQQLVEEVVQRNLRLVLGAQFTEREGERLIARAFNPSLKPEANAKRLRRLFTAMERGLQARIEAAQYFEENNGSLMGYRGTGLVTINDLNRALGDDEPDEGAGSEFAGMGPAELKDVDVGTLNAKQLKAYIAATKAAQDQGLE